MKIRNTVRQYNWLNIPVNLLSPRYNFSRYDMLKIEDGILPVREAFSICKISSLERFPISGGTPPTINVYQHNESLYINHYTKERMPYLENHYCTPSTTL